MQNSPTPPVRLFTLYYIPFLSFSHLFFPIYFFRARQVGVRRAIPGPGVGKYGTVHTGDDAKGQGGNPGLGGHAGVTENSGVGGHAGVGEHPGVVEHPAPAQPESVPQEEVSSAAELSLPEQQPHLTSPVDLQVQVVERRRKRRNVPTLGHQARPHSATPPSQQKPTQKTRGSKRAEASSVTGESLMPNAKRTCLGGSPGVSPQPSLVITGSPQTSNRDHLPAPPLLPPPSLLPPPPPPLLPPVEAKAASTASPVSERCETTVEAELLTPGKRASRLPLTSNNTEQTNQNRLAASLRGLSVRPASSGWAISSRPTLQEEGRKNVPRTSRLRRLKRS